MRKYAIVAIGYNRPLGMKRLLDSLNRSYYANDEVTLIISIDNSGTDSVKNVAMDFEWKFGEKKIVTYPQRLGLRKHILTCGNFVNEFDAIAVFEDDVIVAEGFYIYMKEAVEKYYNNKKIAGISLYNHLWNVNANLPFSPALSEFDTYFMQFAQSWGQVWMKEQWNEFFEWYNDNCGDSFEKKNMPEFVNKWPETSWLKYHIKFCVEKDKYFVYPYKALSSCFMDVGEHCDIKDTHLQIPLLTGVKENYLFPDLMSDNAVFYDVFFERIDKKNFDLCFDIYGKREESMGKRYLLSTQNFPYKIINSYALEMKPHELNYYYSISGNDIFLYDTNEKNNNKVTHNVISSFRYYFRLYSNTTKLIFCVFDKVKNKIGRFF